jgi:hypothetical protein
MMRILNPLLGSVVACVVATASSGCASDDGDQQLSTPAAYQDLFFSYCLSLSEIFTALAEGASTSQVAGAAVACPEGGTATYDPDLGLALLNDCKGAGTVVNGSINGLIEAQRATITSGDLSMTGDFTGTAIINSGTMSWELPVADATTYWELRINLDGDEVCLWSGAETGPCPATF